MAGISTTVSVNDQLSAAFRTMTSSITACIGTFIEMQETADQGLSSAQVSNLNAALVDLNAAALDFEESINSTGGYISDNVDEQERFNQAVKSGTQQADKLTETIKKAVTAYVSIQSIGKVISISDDLAQTTARLDMMNDGVQTTQELTNMIYASAQSARGSFSDMADVVARFGNNAGSAFSSTEEVVAFSELIQKQMTNAGASTQEASNAMLQLSQALGSGVLRGDELNSIYEQAPNLIQNISKYIQDNEELAKNMAGAIGVSYEEMSTNAIGHIRDIASEGLITADIVKASVFSASDEINEELENMPMTWGQVWQSMKNTALISFQPVLNEINAFASSDEIQTVVNGINSALLFMADVALNAFEIMEQGVSFAVDNWSILEPIITGVAVALGAYVVVMTIYNTVQAVSNGLKTLGAIAAVAHGTSTVAEAAATTGMTAAQVSLNAALLACPLTWIVVAIIAVVVALYAGVAAVNKFQGTSISATGIIGAAFAVAGAAILNNFIVPLQNAFASIANFLGNVFNNPVAAVKILIYDMALTSIGYIANMASAIETVINKIPGVTIDITSGLDSFYDSLETAQQQVKDESGWVEYVSKMDYVSYEGAAQTGYDKGSSLESSISDAFGDFAIGDLPDSIASGISDITDTTAETASNTGGIADSLDVTEDSLEWMKDIAEREIIDRTVFRDIKVEMGGVNNTVNNMQDLDSIGQYLANSIEEQMAVSAEGV